MKRTLGMIGMVSLKLLATPSAYALPDILPVNITVTPNAVPANGTLTLSFVTTNQGNATAGPTTTRLRINSSSTSVSTSDPLLGDLATPSIVAGGSVSQSTNINVGSTTGTRYIWVITDNFSAISQSNTANDIQHSP